MLLPSPCLPDLWLLRGSGLAARKSSCWPAAFLNTFPQRAALLSGMHLALIWGLSWEPSAYGTEGQSASWMRETESRNVQIVRKVDTEKIAHLAARRDVLPALWSSWPNVTSEVNGD